MPWDREGITVQTHPELLQRTAKIRELLKLHEEYTLGSYAVSYIETIKKCVKRLMDMTQVDNLFQIENELLIKWKNMLVKIGKAESTINRYLSGVNCFLLFFNIKLQIPFVKMTKGREADIAKCVWEIDSFEKVLETIPYLKYKTMLIFLHEEGPRIGSRSSLKGYPRRGLLGLNWGDIDFEKGTFTMLGKGGKQYVRPIKILTEKYLRMLKESMSKTGNDDPVFQSAPGKRLSYMAAYFTVRKYMSLVPGVKKEQKHFHALRHTRATIATKQRGIRFAKGILMQDNLNSTMIYEHINDDFDLMRLVRPDKVVQTREDLEEKICPICNASVLPDRKLCDCGYDFTVHRCPKCGRSVQKNQTFCAFCGLRISVPKPECLCGEELQIDFNICPHCGRNTDEIKKMWSKRNLEEWNRLSGSNSNIIGETSLTSESSKSVTKAEKAIGIAKSLPMDEKTLKSDECSSEVTVLTHIEQVNKAIREGWDLVTQVSPNEFILRRIKGPL